MFENLKHPPRILITRTDRIGDLVLSTPVFSEVRKKYPNAHLACLTFLENREIVEGNPALDEVILYHKRGSEKGWLGQLCFALKLRRHAFDLVIHLHATNRVHLAAWIAQIPVRIGWRRKCAWTLTQSLADFKKEGRMHEAEYNFELLKLIGVERPKSLIPFFPVSERSRVSLEELLKSLGVSSERPWVVFNPSASCPSKIWPAEKFGALAQKIRGTWPVELLSIGSRRDRLQNQRMQEFSKFRIHDLSGLLTLGMLGALFDRAALLVSNDSGPVHIASARRTPVISIFGRKQAGLSPERWRPLGEKHQVVWKDVGCPECLAHRCHLHFLCLEAVSVEEVFQTVLQLRGRIETGSPS